MKKNINKNVKKNELGFDPYLLAGYIVLALTFIFKLILDFNSIIESFFLLISIILMVIGIYRNGKKMRMVKENRKNRK